MAGRNVELARLFYTLEAETKGLDAELGRVEKSLGRTADFIKANPVAAAGALAAAVLAVGAQATAMAAEVDTAIRRVSAKVPEGEQAFDRFRQVAKDLSLEFGLTQVEVVGVMEAIAAGGISSAEDLEAATRAAVLAQRASGEAFGAVVGALDTSLDTFQLAARDSGKILADLLATAKGHTNLTDLAAVLARVGPVAKTAGVDFQTTIAAIAALQAQGLNTKATVTALKETLEKEGAAGLKVFADAARPAGDTLAAMQEAAEQNNATLAVLNAQLRERLSAVMIDLGTKILPLVVKGFGLLADAIDHFTGSSTKASNIAAVDSIIKVIDTLKPEQVAAKKQALDDLGSALRQLSGGPQFGAQFRDTFEIINAGLAGGLGKRSTEDLLRLRDGLAKVLETGDLTAKQLGNVKESLFALNDEVAKRGDKPIVTPPAPTTSKEFDRLIGQITDVGKGTKKVGEAEKLAAADTKILADRRQALSEITNALKSESVALLDDTKRGIEQLREEMILAGGNVEAVDALLRPLQSRLADLEKRKVAEPLRLAKEEAKKLEKEITAVVLTADALSEAADRVASNVGALPLPTGKVGETFEQWADDVGIVASAAIGIAEQFGIIDSKARAVLENTLAIVTNISAAVGGDPTAIAGVISSLTGILGSIFGGTSPEEYARKELIRKNIEVLARNNSLLELSSPGFAVAGARRGLGKLFTSDTILGQFPEAAFGGIAANKLASFLRDFGVTLSDIEQLFKDSGLQGDLINKEGSVDVRLLSQLFEFLQQDINNFGATLEDQLQRVQIALNTGLIDPADEFGAVVGALGKVRGGAPSALTDALAGLDVSTDRGRELATKALQRLVGDIENISEESLGGLSSRQFLSVLERLIGILRSDREIRGGFELPTTPDRPPVEIDAALDAGFADVVTVGEETNALLAQIVANTRAFTPVAAPALPASLLGPATATGPGLSITGGIHVSLSVTPNQISNPASTGQAIAEALEEQLGALVDRVLAQRYQSYQQSLGSAVRA